MRLGLARTPLHRLTDDIPKPEFMADIWNEVVGVSMSMGHSHSLHRNYSKVRLTSHALDHFIFNVKGEMGGWGGCTAYGPPRLCLSL